METNLHPIMDLRMFASSDKALLIFQLRTLLFGNSFISRDCCSLPIRFCSKTCVSRTTNFWDYKVFRHEYTPQSTNRTWILVRSAVLKPCAGRLVGGTTSEPAVDCFAFLHFAFV